MGIAMVTLTSQSINVRALLGNKVAGDAEITLIN